MSNKGKISFHTLRRLLYRTGTAVLMMLLFLPFPAVNMMEVSSADSVSKEIYRHSDAYLGYPESSETSETSGDNGIFYWIYVSDIHINGDNEHTLLRNEFTEFCNTTVKIINPSFIVSGGDVVDAQTVDYKHQRVQHEWEYQFFRKTLDENNLSDIWYPVIGNHERYNTGRADVYWNEYIHNGTQYVFWRNFTFGKYAFVVTDTVPEYGLGKPFNFYGEVKRDKLDMLESFLPSIKEADGVVFFGHHPLSMILSERTGGGDDFRGIMDRAGAYAYFCGHLHLPHAYNNDGKLLESEIDDFEKAFVYRVVAFDRGKLSFTDRVNGKWPLILITDPPDVRYITAKTPPTAVETGGMLRVLIFDPGNITSTSVEIDGRFVCTLNKTGRNLWTADPGFGRYSPGIHRLTVTVESDSGTAASTVIFTVGDYSYTDSPFSSLGMTFLNIPVCTVIDLALFLSVFTAVTVFSVPCIKMLVRRKRKDRMMDRIPENNGRPTVICGLLGLVFTLYFMIGPIAFGPLVYPAGTLGIIFNGIIFIGGTYVLSAESTIMSLYFILMTVFAFPTPMLSGRRRIRYGKKRRIISAFTAMLFIIYLLMFFGAVYFIVTYFKVWVLFTVGPLWCLILPMVITAHRIRR